MKNEFKIEVEEVAQEFILTGSEAAFTRLYNLLYNLFFGILKKRYIFNDDDLIHDVLSHTFIKIYTCRDKFIQGKSFFNYAYTILVNQSYARLNDIKRRRNHIKKLALFDYTNDVDYDEDIAERYDRTLKAIKNMSWKYKDFLIDKFVNELTTYELMAKYNFSYSDVKNRAQQGKRRIKKIFNEK
jgi:RNA polymerase sigma factor (sigma-70 family)